MSVNTALVLAVVRDALGRLGYWVRPYDMLADRRRWFWQPRQRCERVDLTSYAGQWVAIKRSQVIGHASTARAIVQQMRDLGDEAHGSTLMKVPPPETSGRDG